MVFEMNFSVVCLGGYRKKTREAPLFDPGNYQIPSAWPTFHSWRKLHQTSTKGRNENTYIDTNPLWLHHFSFQLLVAASPRQNRARFVSKKWWYVTWPGNHPMSCLNRIVLCSTNSCASGTNTSHESQGISWGHVYYFWCNHKYFLLGVFWFFLGPSQQQSNQQSVTTQVKHFTESIHKTCS